MFDLFRIKKQETKLSEPPAIVSDRHDVKILIGEGCELGVTFKSVETAKSFISKVETVQKYLKLNEEIMPEKVMKKRKLEKPVKKEKTTGLPTIIREVVNPRRPRLANCIRVAEVQNAFAVGDQFTVPDICRRMGLRKTAKLSNKLSVSIYKLVHAGKVRRVGKSGMYAIYERLQ